MLCIFFFLNVYMTSRICKLRNHFWPALLLNTFPWAFMMIGQNTNMALTNGAPSTPLFFPQPPPPLPKEKKKIIKVTFINSRGNVSHFQAWPHTWEKSLSAWMRGNHSKWAGTPAPPQPSKRKTTMQMTLSALTKKKPTWNCRHLVFPDVLFDAIGNPERTSLLGWGRLANGKPASVSVAFQILTKTIDDNLAGWISRP